MEVNKQLTLEIFSQLEKKWLTEYDSSSRSSSPWSPKLQKKKKKQTCILAIDGGVGASGLVAGEYLIHLEDCIKSKTSNPDARITDFFDLVAGTGIGGILAVMITATSDSSSRNPLFSDARSAVDFLWSNINHLFRPAGILHRHRYKYSTKSLETLLKRVLRSDEGRSLTLKDVCKPVLIPCYDLNSSAPFVFSSSASESHSFNFDLWRICRATSATPGIFRPCMLTSEDGKTTCNAVDGGLVMNNPAAAAVTHAVHNKRDFPGVFGSEDLLVLSLGNACSGRVSRRRCRRNKSSGECDGPAVVEIALDGVSDAVDQVLCNAFSWNRMDYIRIQGNGATMTEDNGETTEQAREVMRNEGARMLKERGVESLPFGAKRLLTETNGERIEGLVQRLITMSVDSGKVLQLPSSPAKNPAVTVLTDSR